jgi:hypothetical protein
MRFLGTSMPTDGRTARAAVAVVALALIGASPNPWAPLTKSDRIASPADCRSEREVNTIDCLGVVLPRTAGEIFVVAPGFTVVGQVPD